MEAKFYSVYIGGYGEFFTYATDGSAAIDTVLQRLGNPVDVRRMSATTDVDPYAQLAFDMARDARKLANRGGK